MAFYGNSFVGPLRTSNEVLIYLNRRQPAPENPPFELQNSVPKAVWTERLTTIQRMSQRYSKPVLERIWLLLAFLSVFIAPLVIYPILARTVEHEGDNESFDDRENNASRFFQARAISFGIFFGLGFLFFAPLLIVKSLARVRVNKVTRAWMNEDLAAAPGRNVPNWRVQLPGAFSSNTTIRISLPMDMPPTNFTMNAYLPSFINGPADPGAQGYYQQNLDAVPLFSEKSAHYAAPRSPERRLSGGSSRGGSPTSGRASPTQNPFADKYTAPRKKFDV